VEFWSAYGFGVVWVRFYVAVVCEGYGGFLWFLVRGFWELLEEVVDVFDYEFGLSPAWSNDADVHVWVGQRVMQEQRAYGVALSCLPCPSCGYELACLELVYEFGLVGGWVEAEGFSAELNGIGWEGVLLFLR
jgi:hypothetical protein